MAKRQHDLLPPRRKPEYGKSAQMQIRAEKEMLDQIRDIALARGYSRSEFIRLVFKRVIEEDRAEKDQQEES